MTQGWLAGGDPEAGGPHCQVTVSSGTWETFTDLANIPHPRECDIK